MSPLEIFAIHQAAGFLALGVIVGLSYLVFHAILPRK
ncbi:hypothetical protein J2S04_000843 [Alicyclobacillus tengchongensis]|uniref:Uncharacterized protein n=2 Tax=Alicyclobacillus tolerans TaxID=90970 RepID=A0ABT9LUH4_9BACL|nr:hypothetical protein [Alicyclobacillus tengchongensis]SHK52237.1 hypothetical protein SAMN05443507_11578 [Alicyclobacillus montanus]